MAEIGIEKKKPVWPWIILVLVILAILYFLFFANDDDADDMDDTNIEQVEDTTTWDDETTDTWDTDDTMTGNYSQEVQSYLTYVGDKSRMGIDHEYTNNALIELMNAVESKANEENVDIDIDMQEIRQGAHEITEDPLATDHAGIIKNTGMRIVDALEKIQVENYPDLSTEVEEIENALQEIDTSVLTLEQRETVNSFFDEAADLFQKMS